MKRSRLKVITFVGTRPEIIRLSRVISLLDNTLSHFLVHTGQNFDYELNEIFFKDLGLRTPDYFLNVNTTSLGRVYGETLIKSEVTTLTRFPIRRLDMQIGVAYKEDIDRVKRVLTEVAEKNPLCLEEPKPLYIFQGFGDSAMNLQFSVWATRENFLELKNSMHERVKSAFDQQGIEIPFPHRSIYAGSMTEPLPVKVMAESKPD